MPCEDGTDVFLIDSS